MLFAGPLAGTEASRIQVLLIADAADEAQLKRHLAEDPWQIAQRIQTTSIEPWTLLVGAQRMPTRSLDQR